MPPARSRPPPSVLAAFGHPDARPVPLGGGQGRCWRAGDLVLKPVDADPAELAWRAEICDAVCSRVRGGGFRLARPVRTADGALAVAGWCATGFLPGRHEPGRWPQVVTTGERLHAALRDLPRPAFLDRRDDRWAVADRVAWGEAPATGQPRSGPLRRLADARRPVRAVSQLVHGDLTGNVLFHDRLPPAVIDLSPYWRPPAYATAIVVADALLWEGADAGLLAAVSHVADLGQYLVRALLFRAVAEQLSTGAVPSDATGRWSWTADLACRYAAGRRATPPTRSAPEAPGSGVA